MHAARHTGHRPSIQPLGSGPEGGAWAWDMWQEKMGSSPPGPAEVRGLHIVHNLAKGASVDTLLHSLPDA